MESRCNEPSIEGATVDSIVRYVLQHTRLTEPSARHAVIEVLNLGVSLGRIAKTASETYILQVTKPPAVTHRIREPRFTDDSSSESSAGSNSD